jgi:hypothetical protein
MQTPLAMWCRQLELYPKFLHDLHNWQASTKEEYLKKMSQNSINGSLWGDFTTIIWISLYLQRQIYVSSTTSVQIMMKCGEEYDSTLLMHLVFGIQHFELIQNNDFM